ncbi:MAG: bifunctional lysylphosphatidylglycerol flippase/synthetase MprF, partial [Acidobacteria bacterium]|nr:bifunctional lysylphosphatidylglycerol flippase/synthetase MprF [Acidobacteriota bacterium]
PDDARPGLIRSFLERADDFGGVPAFYEIGAPQLHLYADQGLAFVKLGEEAVVDLARFSLEGGHGAKYRQSMRRLEREGGVFRVAPAEDVPAMMASLTDVSNDWLRHKAGAEKGFSLGFFDDAYLQRFPVAVIERGGRIQAFANLWRGADGVELSVDLMRYGREAPRGVMEALFVHLLDWGRQNGYRRFSLGMAPLSGVEDSPLAPLWNRVGAFVYEHGESMYGFQGLRGFKDKFDPVWEARYLAYPGGFRLPRILADVSALIAGGYRQLLLK